MEYIERFAASWPLLVGIGSLLVLVLLILICAAGIVHLATRGQNLNPLPATNPAAIIPPAAVTRSWWYNLHSNWSSGTAWRVIQTLLVILVACALLYLIYDLYQGISLTEAESRAKPLLLAEWKGIPGWILLLGLIAFVIMFMSANLADVRASGIMLAIILLTVFAYTLYVNGGLEVGYRRYLGYALIIGLGWMAAKFLVSDRQRSWAGYLLFATFVILGISSMWTWDQLHPSWSGDSARVASKNPCDRTVRHVRVSTGGSIVNPGGACSYSFEVTKGQLYFHGPEGSTEVWWPGKPPIGNVRKRIMTAYAVTPDAELDYLLCPAGMDGTGWYCH